ncbi:MAG: hypothetical protein Ct9H90mP11_00350 [Acidimicrobiales bacterium]|nr:MAG: hypothetical protein Ct9H90mP11_00350 [Acidimicrobiales bacterium]
MCWNLRGYEISDPIERPHSSFNTIRLGSLSQSSSMPGEYQVKPALPWTPGGESAGIVTKIGDGVTDIEPGDRVMMLGGA